MKFTVMKTIQPKFSTLLLLCAFGPFNANGFAQEDASGQELTEVESIVATNAELFVKAFNQRDAETLGNFFTDSGQMILDGVVVATGPDEVKQRYMQFFDSDTEARIKVELLSARRLAPNRRLCP